MLASQNVILPISLHDDSTPSACQEVSWSKTKSCECMVNAQLKPQQPQYSSNAEDEQHEHQCAPKAFCDEQSVSTIATCEESISIASLDHASISVELATPSTTPSRPLKRVPQESPQTRMLTENLHASEVDHANLKEVQRARVIKFFIGATGICISYLVQGWFQEDLFSYTAANGAKFHYAWLLQLLESMANLFVGLMVRLLMGGESDLPFKSLFVAGTSQLFAKAFTSLSLAAGLSYPICTLSKSAKMVPVMLGQLFLGGSSYRMSDYLIAVAIVCGTTLLSLGQLSAPSLPGHETPVSTRPGTTLWGVVFIVAALCMDGVTAGLQAGLKEDMKRVGKSLHVNDFLLWSNVSMAIIAGGISVLTQDWADGSAYLLQNPVVLRMVAICCCCSVVGQGFIYYMITNFDPLACTTVTTSRKIMSVLCSITAKGHFLSPMGGLGVALACGGICVETRNKLLGRTKKIDATHDTAPATSTPSTP